MVEQCISEMASSSLRSPTLPREVVALRANVDHQPREEDPLAIQGEKIWQDIVDLQCPTQV